MYIENLQWLVLTVSEEKQIVVKLIADCRLKEKFYDTKSYRVKV